MAALQDRLRADLTGARKARNKPLTLVLGTVLAEIGNQHIAAKRDLTDDDVVEVLRRAIKRRKESVEAYEKGGRPELAVTERQEAASLEGYLPAPVGDDELRAAVRSAVAAGATTLGAVMGKVVPQFRGRAEGGTISRIAREELDKSA